MNLFFLVTDPLGAFLPQGVMEFLVPGAVAAGLLSFVLYMLLREWELLPDLFG